MAAPQKKQLLKYLREQKAPVNMDRIADAFEVRDHKDLVTIESELKKLEHDGECIVDRAGRYALVERMDISPGRVIGHKDGFGFVALDSGGGDLFLSPREMRQVLHGDRVLAREQGKDRRGRPNGTIIEVLEHVNQQVVGHFYLENGIGYVSPDNKRIHQDIFIPPDKQLAATSGQIVVAAITKQPGKRSKPTGQITEVLGEHMAPGMEIQIAIQKHEIPNTWPKEVAKQLKGIDHEIDPAQVKQRRDIRSLALVTIDGEDARDFDDAVYCEPLAQGWRLLVAIADVSSYVTTDSALDKQAFVRGTSVYFPNEVIPMLPEKLSNGLCSLNPDVDRLCFVCEMQVSESGEITQYEFYEAVMRSHARLTYTEVAAVLSATKDHRADSETDINNLQSVALKLRHRRFKAGSIDLDIAETRIIYDDQRKIERIVPTERNDAHRLIEDCMLAANICAARMILAHDAPGVYRVHERPSLEKLEDVRKVCLDFGLVLGGGDEPTADDYAEVINASRDQPYTRLIHTSLLRSFQQAIYSADCNGHFALGFDAYAHFTSPIRRYPDLLVHRVIKAIIKKGPLAKNLTVYEQRQKLAEHCSITERRADEATREVIKWLKAEYMQEHLGESFTGIVSGVTDFGVFVELDNVFVEGLIHVTGLGPDYFHFDPVRRRLVGEHSGQVYQIGQEVAITVARVDLDQARIDFELSGQAKSARKPAKNRRSTNKKKSFKDAKDNRQTKKPKQKKKRRTKHNKVGTPVKPKGKSRSARRRSRQKKQ